MNKEVVVLIAEDDDGHASLIERNLRRAGVSNEVVRFSDGQEVWDFIAREGDGPHRVSGKSYLLLLDIRMPKLDGVEVLSRIKADHDLKKLPVVMITTTDDPREVDRCHRLGCSSYLTKPIEYDAFVQCVRQLGLFLAIVEIPVLNGAG